MRFPATFIAATEQYNTGERLVPAPLLRKRFSLDGDVDEAGVLICGLGFYELYINGARVSKLLAPYISAPDDIVYYDRYDIAEHLRAGENVVGVILGNGMQNAFTGVPWEFDKARWRGAPKVSLRMEIKLSGGEFTLESDESFKTHPSPITFDDLRCGEYHDARLEVDGWDQPGFDDLRWKTALIAPMPIGDKHICAADPIVVTHELKPVSVTKQEGGYLYDFGQNCAGVCRLRISGARGQEIKLTHGERLVNGMLDVTHLSYFVPEGCFQKDIYILKGEGPEEYTPRFTYHGFQYVFVEGVTEEQAVNGLLTYLVMNSDLKERGGFKCSDEVANTLQILTRRSTLANFYYFPTDCPHREKNGWTGDAAISAEHTLLNLSAENSYKEWLRNIRKAQNGLGQLPGIVPTGGWGYTWGNGPAWDCVLTYLPYYTYVYRGDPEILVENGTAIFRYLHYLSALMRRGDGLIEVGLGDWCPPGGEREDDYKAPLKFTDSVISMDICEKAAFIYKVLNWENERVFAENLSEKLRRNIRNGLIDFGSMTAAGNCQTSQAMALYYGVFEQKEKQAAFAALLRLIDEADGHMDTGILGARVIFHVLSDFGESDLAFKMITQPTFPSYGNWVARGATSLWEDFQPEGGRVLSLNHHFFGDISGWFIKHIAGIRYNPGGDNHKEALISPSFIDGMDFAEGFHITPLGEIMVKWKRVSNEILLRVTMPEGFTGNIVLENGFIFANGESAMPISGTNAEYVIKRRFKNA